MRCRLARRVSDGQRSSASLMIARPNAPVAQLDRVAASEAAGRLFESSRARQIPLPALHQSPGRRQSHLDPVSKAVQMR